MEYLYYQQRICQRMTKEDSERKKAYDNAYKQMIPEGPTSVVVGDEVILNPYRSSIRGSYKLPNNRENYISEVYSKYKKKKKN